MEEIEKMFFKVQFLTATLRHRYVACSQPAYVAPHSMLELLLIHSIQKLKKKPYAVG